MGQLVRFHDHNYKRNVTGIVTFCERPLGYNVYTVKSRVDGTHHTNNNNNNNNNFIDLKSKH